MIDYEDEIIGTVAAALRAAFPDIIVFDETILSPSVFPCVCIEEIDNYTYRRTVDSGCHENHVRVAYEVNVHSNKTHGKRSECRRIFAEVSDVFTGLGFARLSMTPITNEDATRFRLVGRFSGVVSKNGEISRR